MVMPVGNCSVLNTESNQMVKCHQTRQSEEEMMPSTPFSQKLVQESTSQEPSFWIWNQQLLMKSEQEHTDNYSTQNN